MFWNTKPKDNSKNSSLEQVLKDNKSKFKVNHDGFISIDLASQDALKAIREQVDKIEDIAVKA
ncbi:TPA: hypothetical protein SLZ51_000777 [Vibrio cholerae]|uniref:hypothetical protein n=1 Tax=Vibrio cholerae TaxID=666 RepID=UPI001A29CC36|nr:hypothetical protein [Vibrio cholerae]EGQ7787109.1 hypothetical protein [Vibrio cholerae]EGQ7967701.1 hypothetical protein [Vibrio cholerae]EIY4763951.1 hypothetical protein [Vibrio cholerae]EJL6688694.1 hypothetical protein [Vibrio cholerae]EJX1706588.1 hypothetical protein [Vibrio cholerae]